MPSKIGFAAQASLRSVPTCPVCLERVDVSVFGNDSSLNSLCD